MKSDAEIGLSARSTQSALTPVIQQMKDAKSNYGYNTGTLGLMVAMRKEAKLQGLNVNDIIWDCSTVCYDKNFLQQGGGDVEGVNMTLAFLPFEETKTNKALASYVKGVGADNVAAFGAYAWVAGLLFRDSVNAIVKRDGVNGLTRAALLEQLKNTHAFDGDGMWSTTDVGNRVPPPCFMITHVKNGKFAASIRRSRGPWTARRATTSSTAATSSEPDEAPHSRARLRAQLGAQVDLADLAGCGAWEVVDDAQLLRPLLAREAEARELRRDVLEVEVRRPWREAHDGACVLAEARVGGGDHRDLGDLFERHRSLLRPRRPRCSRRRG